ncbi:uncharacterized protein LOC133806145 [Humulus lupulus]|uniref:uncharacterized protein LOC133806145 n=1 Tax=Humulus lupulus TaxID=3486 RepID=UPI002B414A95|nr:uncharacterized protein LOC133806145 [Humulus lupulus]
MPFGLKNARALQEFAIIRKYRMKLNPKKYTFGIASGKFMGFILSSRGIEANLDKIKALIEMSSPQKHIDVQSLTGRIAALSRFVSKSTNKCISFFNILRKCQRFKWMAECEEAFQKLKEHLAQVPILSKLVDGESLYLYLFMSENAISTALVWEKGKVQLSVYYVRKRLLGGESRYPLIEKLTFLLLIASQKLRHYFQANAIKILTNHPLRQELQKPKSSGRLLKWAMKLSQFDIAYVPRISIKGQALADFIVECTGITEDEEPINPVTPLWKVFVDGALNENGVGAEIILISPQGHQLQSALHFQFEVSNNEAEHEAMLAGLRLAREVGAASIKIYSYSQLVVRQISGEYQTKGERMAAYVTRARELLQSFKKYLICQIPREQNVFAETLAKLATDVEAELLGLVPINHLPVPSNQAPVINTVDYSTSWMGPLSSTT